MVSNGHDPLSAARGILNALALCGIFYAFLAALVWLAGRV